MTRAAMLETLSIQKMNDSKKSNGWKYWLVVVGLLLMTSCGPAAKLRRAERLIKKAEAMGAVWHVDTVYTEREIPVPRVQRDTVVVNAPGDTIYITKERLRVKVKVQRDSIYVSGECLPDTIKVNVPVTVTKTIEVKRGIPWWVWLLATFCYIGGTWMGIKLSKK